MYAGKNSPILNASAFGVGLEQRGKIVQRGILKPSAMLAYLRAFLSRGCGGIFLGLSARLRLCGDDPFFRR